VTGFLRWQDLLDIFIVAFVIYRVFLLMKGTRAVQLVVGLIIVLFAFYVAKQLDLFTLGWILNNFVASILLVIVVVFQNDIRRVLFALGRSPFLSKITYVEETLFYDELVNACVAMSARRVGALIVVEREAGLDEFVEIGVKLDAEVNAELVVSLFQPQSPLHDGALIIKEGRIRAGSCVLPLTMKEGIDKGLGTRHRAAIGITEVSDSIAVVVSEETGKISYAVRGDIVRPVNGEELKKALKGLLGARK
jgi:uncharacterized protein (TIGR00159 family)